MLDRRTFPRKKVYFGGLATFDQGRSTVDCVLKNIGQEGAKAVLSDPAAIPDEFELEIDRLGLRLTARIMWRGRNELGLTFVSGERSNVIPFDAARRQRQIASGKVLPSVEPWPGE